MFQIKPNNQDGYVLPYLLVTILLITTLLVLTVNLFYFYNKYEIKKYNKKKLELACYSAVQQFIAANKFSPTVSITENYSYKIDSTAVNLVCGYKGLYLQATAFAKNRNDSVKVTYLLAENISSPFENAIVITRSGVNPVVAGNTKIVGDVVSSSKNYKMENLTGVGKPTNKWIDGKTKVQEMIPPKLFNDSLFTRNISRANKLLPPNIKVFVKSLTLDDTNIAEFDSLKNIYIKGDLTIKGSLLNEKRKTQKIFVDGITKIETKVKSNIDLEIYCDSTAVINPNCEIENMILYAKSNLTISQDVTCKNVQFFSERGIDCEKVVMNYPSILLMYVDSKNASKQESMINIKSSRINGSILLLASVPGVNTNKSKILIKESTVQGIVYSENITESYGSIIGSVYTNSFLFFKKPTEYFNWLVDLNINRKKLDQLFLQPIGFTSTSKFSILREKWEY